MDYIHTVPRRRKSPVDSDNAETFRRYIYRLESWRKNRLFTIESRAAEITDFEHCSLQVKHINYSAFKTMHDYALNVIYTERQRTRERIILFDLCSSSMRTVNLESLWTHLEAISLSLFY